MNSTTDDSKIIDFELRSISFEKGNMKGLEVIEGALKESISIAKAISNEEMEINTFNGELTSNDILKSETGKVTKFPENSYNTISENIQYRGTGKVIRMKARNIVKMQDRKDIEDRGNVG